MTLSFLLSLSILLPLTIGLIRVRKIETSYQPFIVLIALGLLTEIASTISIRVFGTNAVVTNVFFLLECLLILYLFYCWRFNARPRKWHRIVPLVLVAGWIVQNLVLYKIVEFSPFFHVAYSFIIVILSINEINYLITHENRQLLKNAEFIICLGFIIFFIYQILYEGSYYISVQESKAGIARTITSYHQYINVLTNIIYAIGIWFIPEKKMGFNRTMESLKEQQRRSGAKLPP